MSNLTAAYRKTMLTNVRTINLNSTASRIDTADALADIVNAVGYVWAKQNIELSPSTLKRIIENVKPYNPSSRTTEKVCEATGITISLA